MASLKAGDTARIVDQSAWILDTPSLNAKPISEALYGEMVTIIEPSRSYERDKFAQVILTTDGYGGYINQSHLVLSDFSPTHRVAVCSAPLRMQPDVKARPLRFFGMHSQVQALGEKEGFVQTEQGWIFAKDLLPIAERVSDWVSVGESLLGTPYIWAGRNTSRGLDCSGFIQLLLQASGQTCPRDSVDQEWLLNSSVQIQAEYSGFERGDLVFWPGHVGVITNGSIVNGPNLLHATADHMRVCKEHLPSVVARRGIYRSVRRL